MKGWLLGLDYFSDQSAHLGIHNPENEMADQILRKTQPQVVDVSVHQR